MLRSLARRADFSDPETVKGVIARHDVSEGRKENLVCVYDGFCRQCDMPFERPRDRRIEELLFIPVKSEIDQLSGFNAMDVSSEYGNGVISI